jgi:inhibitor of cysteine peptidase
MSVIQLEESDAGSEVGLKPGASAEILLAENPTTGFRWTWEERGDLEIAAEREPGGRAIGAAGWIRLRVRPLRVGRHELRLRLMREWSEEIARERRFTFLADPAESDTT